MHLQLSQSPTSLLAVTLPILPTTLSFSPPECLLVHVRSSKSSDRGHSSAGLLSACNADHFPDSFCLTPVSSTCMQSAQSLFPACQPSSTLLKDYLIRSLVAQFSLSSAGSAFICLLKPAACLLSLP